MSRKQCVVERNGEKFGHTGLLSQHTYTKQAEKDKQEVGSTKQQFGSYLGNVALQSKTDKNLDPLGYTYSIYMPNMTEKSHTVS